MTLTLGQCALWCLHAPRLGCTPAEHLSCVPEVLGSAPALQNKQDASGEQGPSSIHVCYRKMGRALFKTHSMFRVAFSINRHNVRSQRTGR